LTNRLTDDDRDTIINLLGNDDMSQQDIADKIGCSQSTVSFVKCRREAGGQNASEENETEEIMKFNFDGEDETEEEEDDEYWCAYCQEESDKEVSVDYMQEECPNGHDLSGDWGDFGE